jgi:glycosyltransferase involved in cell wall biosynthesis
MSPGVAERMERMGVRPRKKLIFVNRFYHPDQSATSQILHDLATGLARRGFDIHVLCSGQLYDDPDAKLPAAEVVDGIRVRRVPTTRFGRGRLVGRAVDYASFYLSAGAALWRLVRGADIVVAKTDPPLISLVCALVVRFRRAVLINWQQDVFPEIASALGANPLPRPLDASLRRWRNAAMRHAAVNVVIGQRMREYFIKLGIPRAKLAVVENWSDPTAIAPLAPGASRLRAEQGLLDRFVVGYSGNLGRAHEFATLLGAAQALRDTPGIVFLIIGGGARMPALRQAVAERELENFVFLPYQPRERLGDSLAAADLHVVSLVPKLEGLIVPSKFYGILAAARPVVFIGDHDGEIAPEIRAADCGLVIDVGDSERLARELRALQLDAPRCLGMGRRARALLTEKYDVRLGIDKWAVLLEQWEATPSVRPADPVRAAELREP